MNKVYFKYLLILLFSFLTNKGFSSHVPGGNITYECLGNNRYVITLNLFENCGTAFIKNETKYKNSDAKDEK